MLVIFLNGAKQPGSSMYFYDIDRCIYFRERIGNQKDYDAICKPVLVDPTKTQVYR